mmetsp:Transcript_33475/g.104849  ORF Transcript_33475/g.104849 Transcript_33475/m.104849 type:complete len:256 (+) Transcript_33475:536-1303(+)
MRQIREDRVEGVQHHYVVEAANGGQQHDYEAVEGALVPQPNTVVDPGAVVVKPVDTSPTLLAVVGPHPPPRPADHADLPEVAPFEQGQVFAAALCKQLLHASSADALRRRPLALQQRQGRALQLRLPRHRDGAVVRQAADQRLQLGAAHPVATSAPLAQPLPRCADELALVVVLRLLEFHSHEAAARQTLLVFPILREEPVVVGHLRLNGLLGVEGSGGVVPDDPALGADGARLDPPRICGAVLHPEEQRGAHEH